MRTAVTERDSSHHTLSRTSADSLPAFFAQFLYRSLGAAHRPAVVAQDAFLVNRPQPQALHALDAR
jgi:hypothetical protein